MSPVSAPPWRLRVLVALRLTLVAVATATVTLALYLRVVGVPPTATASPSPIRGDMRDIVSTRPGIRVLFLGDSLTDANSMTSMVEKLAAGVPGGPAVFTYQAAPGGAWLEQALGSSTVINMLLRLRWTDVVLQENSHVADHQELVTGWTIPDARALDRYIAVSGARPVVFEAWGYRHGYPYVYPVDSYHRAQEREQYAAQTLQAAIGGQLAPVGYAWSQAVAQRPGLRLWQPDGVHPSQLGSYLTAAVFYDLLTGRDATVSRYEAGVNPTAARWLRQVALSAVEHAGAEVAQSLLPAIRDDPWSGSNRNP